MQDNMDDEMRLSEKVMGKKQSADVYGLFLHMFIKLR